MKRLLLALLCATIPAYASNTTVTATVTDTDGQAWLYGSWNASLVLPGGKFRNVTPTVSGAAIPTTASGVMDGSGILTATLTDLGTLDQSGGQWAIQACPYSSASSFAATGCVTVTTSKVTGASVSLTASFTGVTAPRFAPGNYQYGYSDTEVLPTRTPGITYYNVLTGLRQWDDIRKQWEAVSTGGGSMVYPGAGISVSSGSAWGTSYTAQGSDSKLLTSGTVSGTGANLCTDANGGATTTGCTSGSGSGTVSGQASGVIPLGTAATTIGAQSHLSDNGTSVTSTEPVLISAGGSAYIGTQTTSNTDIAGQLTLSSGTASYTFSVTNASAPICTATDTTGTNAVKVTVTTTTLTVTGTGTDVVNYVCIART